MATDFNKLVTLCQEEKFTELEELVEDINIQDERGDTLLIKCCYHEYDNAVKHLIKNRNNFHIPLDINKCGEEEDTPLHVCIRNFRLDMLKYLIENGADIEKENVYGSVLGYACSLLYSEDNIPLDNILLDIIKYLIEIGANVNISDGQGRTPLYDACIAKNLDLIKLLLDKGANKYSGDTIYGNLFENIIHEINHERINKHEITYKEVLKFLFDNINISNININIFTIRFNIGHDRYNISFRDYRHTPTIKIFFDCSIITDINKQNSEGDTLLHCACKIMKIDMIKYLLDKGVDKYIKNSQDKTPIDFVRELEDKERAEEILNLMFPEDRSRVKNANTL